MGERLQGKVALITGGAGGQGAAEARLFADEGARIVVADILDDEGETLAQELRDSGAQAEYRHLDVSSESEWQDIVAHIADTHGALHILVNNAGIAMRRPSMQDVSLDDWNRVMAINLTGPFLGIKAASPLIGKSGGGAIVNTGSIAGMMGHFATAYTAAKWGLRGLTKNAAMELAAAKIRVNAVHPGIVVSRMTEGSEDFIEAMTWMTPLARPGTADDIAKTVLFLVSDEAGYITGLDIPVDGGMSELGAYKKVFERVMEQANQSL